MSNEKIKVDMDTFVPPWNNGIDYELLKDTNDKRQLYHSDVSDPDYLENTFNFYKSTGMSLTNFLKQFDILKLKRQSFAKLREDYADYKKKIEEIKEEVEKLLKLDERDLVNRERKKLKAYLSLTFNIQRYKYYDTNYMDDVIGLE
jgi:hypothetical protein